MDDKLILRESAPFTASDLIETVKNLRKCRSLMWYQAQKDGKLDYAIQYYEVVRSLIYGIYFTWEKYQYERGWLDSIAEEGEDLIQYQMFQVGVVERIEGLLQACKSNNILDMFPEGQETNEMLILIYEDFLSNVRDGNIILNKYNKQSLKT